MMFQPKFSIIIPTFNRQSLLPKTIQSVLDQNYSSYEIIVVDDGSTDRTESIVRKFESEILTYVKTSNRERGAARNTGTSLAKGKYVYFLDSDDILYKDHLSKAAVFLKDHNNPPWFFQEYETVQSSGLLRKLVYNRIHPVKDLICKGNFLSCHGVFLRYDIAGTYPFPEDRTMAGSEDYALWIQLAARYPLLINPVITSALIEHTERSVYNFKPQPLIARKNAMLTYVLEDKEVVSKFKRWLPHLKANTYSYIALHLTLSGHKRKAIPFVVKTIFTKRSQLLTKRMLVIIKRMVFN